MIKGNLRKKRFLLAYGFRGLESIMAGQKEWEAGLSQRKLGGVYVAKLVIYLLQQGLTS